MHCSIASQFSPKTTEKKKNIMSLVVLDSESIEIKVV